MPIKCPKCGSASSQKVAPAKIAAGRMEDPAFLAMLAVNATSSREMGSATAPNAPDRACSSCGAGFRARLSRCPGCGSSRLARVVHRSREQGGHAGAGPARRPGKEAAARAELGRIWDEVRSRGEGGSAKVADEIRRLLDRGPEAAAGWKALQAELGFASLPYSGAVNRPTLACSECSRAFRPRPVRCPRCGSEEIARIQYGYPAFMPDEDDWVELGGCCVSPGDPGMACRACRHAFGKSGL